VFPIPGLRPPVLGVEFLLGPRVFAHWNPGRKRLLFVVLWHSKFAIKIDRFEDAVAEVNQRRVTISILSPDGQIHTKENALQIKFKT